MCENRTKITPRVAYNTYFVRLTSAISANHSAIKQGNACITSSSRPDGWLKQFKISATPVAYFSRVPHLLGDRAPFESRPETVGWFRLVAHHPKPTCQLPRYNTKVSSSYLSTRDLSQIEADSIPYIIMGCFAVPGFTPKVLQMFWPIEAVCWDNRIEFCLHKVLLHSS